ncbi:MAG: hypothetical protein IJK60_10395 [Clostridia bacterium]|nr:hypothetical protein [Clostridia bacterium]
MDYKAKAEEIVKKIKSDKNIKADFENNPVKVIESFLGVDLPDDAVNKVIDLIKAKLTADTVKDVAGKLSSILGKKD